MLGKRLANSRLPTVGDKPVEEVCGGLGDTKSRARFDKHRAPDKIIDIQIIIIQIINTLRDKHLNINLSE